MITGSWIFIIAIFTALNHKTCHKTVKIQYSWIRISRLFHQS